MTTFKSFHAKGSLPVKPPRDRRIVVATDASVCENGAALAYASSHGHYGLNAHPYPATMSGPARSTVCELRAILMALEAVLDEAAKMPVRVLTDSEAALSFLRKWKQGGADMPHGYSTYLRSSGGNASLVALSRKVQRVPTLSFRLVRGHNGHPLNETADSLAKLGLRHGRAVIKTDDAKRLAPLWAQRGHADYMNFLVKQEAGGAE